MEWLAAYLYIGGIPIALHHTDNLMEGRKRNNLVMVGTSFLWPIFWPPVYAFSLIAAAFVRN